MSKEMRKAIRIASKKLKFLRESKINENLSYFCGSYADAFKAGADEAQSQIVQALRVAVSEIEKQGE